MVVLKKITSFNPRKFNEVILYILAHSPKGTLEGKKKLAKLLYFVDFNSFEAFETSVTGATYRALPMGPVPQELDLALSALDGKDISISTKETGLENDTIVYTLKSPATVSFKLLTDQDKRILDKVIGDYGKLSGKVLQDITHSEAPYNAVVPGEEIPYELSFYRGKQVSELVGQ